MFKRFVSCFLVICVIFGMFFISPEQLNNTTAFADSTAVISGRCYTIQHVGSGKYLDINGGSTENGACLQIWDRIYGNENQNFLFYDWGGYWTITPCHSNKAIEIRNSSYDDCAPAAQWEYAVIPCQQWIVEYNYDGTVSFKNKNSGKYLDVYGNGTASGTPLIQYTRNDTTAQRFRISHVKTAISFQNGAWTRSFSKSDIRWTQYGLTSNTYNYTRFGNNGAFKYPTTGYRYLYKYEYIDAGTVHNIVVKKSLNSSTLQSIIDISVGETEENVANAFLKALGYGDFSGTGIALGIIETLATAEENANWNKFAQTTRSGKGICKKTYIVISPTQVWGPLNDGTDRWGWNTYITESKTYEYEVWDGEIIIFPLQYNGHFTISYNYQNN